MRTWHAEAQALYEFIRDKKLPVFKRTRGLLEAIQRAEGIAETEPLAQEDARVWRETLQTLVTSGQAAHKWDRFMAAYTPLRERYRGVYQTLHQQRDNAVAQARQQLESAGVPTQALFTYECQGFKWAEDGLSCDQCSAPPKELYLQSVALPNLVRELREQYETDTRYDEKDKGRMHRLQVFDHLPRRVAAAIELDDALAALRGAVDDALKDTEVVVLE